MIKEFTFISIAYNHEKYIRDHLDSIKGLILFYGKDMKIDLIFSDDHSADHTLHIARDWLEENRSLFRSVEILESEENQGIVSSIVRSIKKCKTREFKFLAGDDLYYTNNIFELFNNELDSLVITPLLPIWEDGFHSTGIISYFKILAYAKDKEKLLWLMRYDNFISAPGAFPPCSILRSEEYLQFISQYRDIEDIPTWQYLLFVKKVRAEILFCPYVQYRIGSGISTNTESPARKRFYKERDQIIRQYRLRRYRYPKYLNIYRYLYKLFEMDMKRHKGRVENKIRMIPELKKYYIENREEI